MVTSARTTYIQQCLVRMREGELSASDDLIRAACERLTVLTRAMFRDYSRVRRWEDTEDVLQGALMRLHRALQSIVPDSPRDFYRLATLQIRRELIDLSRHHFGPAGPGRWISHRAHEGETPCEPANSTFDPGKLLAWSELHQRVEQLPDDEREVFELIWYQDLKQVEVAELLSVSSRTVLRRWHRACLLLHDAIL